MNPLNGKNRSFQNEHILLLFCKLACTLHPLFGEEIIYFFHGDFIYQPNGSHFSLPVETRK